MAFRPADSYATTQAKANAVLAGFQTNLGANTVRLPVNYPTISSSYWASYRGVIDAAASRGMRVILSYWEAASDRDGTVDNTTQFWSMWQSIVSAYGGNSAVHFEPFNEPYGYSDADWKNIAAQWLSNYPSVPRGRVIISGAGYNQRPDHDRQRQSVRRHAHLPAHVPVLQQQPYHGATVA